MMVHQPTSKEILEASRRIAPFINHTPVLTSHTFNHWYNCEFFFKCENFQKVGAFKARGATNAVFSLSEKEAARGVATHSSGNHAQALARAAALRGITAYIVMPSNSAQVKVDAVKGYGGKITFCEPTLEARESTLAIILKETGAIEVHPFNNLKIIEGQATAALELINEVGNLDIIISPVGGGGLLSGTALAAHYFASQIKIIAAEPAQADDAFRSFENKQFIPSINPDTIADGLRTSLGSITFPIILEHVQKIVTVGETDIVSAMRLLWERMKIVVEPSSAVAFAAVQKSGLDVAGKRVGIILSGGNVDLNQLPWLKHE